MSLRIIHSLQWISRSINNLYGPNSENMQHDLHRSSCSCIRISCLWIHVGLIILTVRILRFGEVCIWAHSFDLADTSAHDCTPQVALQRRIPSNSLLNQTQQVHVVNILDQASPSQVLWCCIRQLNYWRVTVSMSFLKRIVFKNRISFDFYYPNATRPLKSIRESDFLLDFSPTNSFVMIAPASSAFIIWRLRWVGGWGGWDPGSDSGSEYAVRAVQYRAFKPADSSNIEITNLFDRKLRQIWT